VTKFLHREDIYSGLLKTVTEYEEKIDSLRADNELWREKLHELQISQSETVSVSQKSASYAPEINALEKKLLENQKSAN